MTSEEAMEFPPLDNAPDISRETSVATAEGLRDNGNRIGYGLLGAGVLTACATLLAGLAGENAIGLGAAVITVICLLIGTALTTAARRRNAAMTAENEETSRWQVIPREE
ncbi:hypothetical protein ACFVUS_06175 [Nocardia sp. NPDC058058]|uniref:hypothetical protein n=1 Tax=Nocardia sp. NPDC058058 TaxID=3346317 RepID=UPI0036DEDAA9